MIEIYPRGDRQRPPGEWRQVQPQFGVAGIVYRRREAERFVRGAADCDRHDLEYGLRVVREPGNPHDPKALAVYGYWMARRWFGRSPERREVQIGYVPRDVARIVPKDAPVAAEIESLYLAPKSTSGMFVNVQAYLLLPGLRSGFWEGRKNHPFR